ncbi:MAG: hypothetical protein DMD54_02115 [Gemmatimonadetes bacterium]|nr:MAG: hypothetical protein DMD54_02115 [Gemmatimonadota bacterium]
MTTYFVSVGAAIAITIAGAVVDVVTTMWLRSRSLARLAITFGSHERAEWAYAITFWLLAVLLGLAYSALGLIPTRVDVALTGGSTLVILGLVWPPYMQDPGFTSTQRSVQRAVAIVIGVILLVIAAGHTG